MARGHQCLPYFMALLLPVAVTAQNPILRSATGNVPSMAGVAGSIITQNGHFLGIGNGNPTQRLTISGYSAFNGQLMQDYAPTIRFEFPAPNSGLLGSPFYWHLTGGASFHLTNAGSGNTCLSIAQDGATTLMNRIRLNVPNVSGGNNQIGIDVSALTRRRIFWSSWTGGTNDTQVPLEFMYEAFGSGTDMTVLKLMPTGQVRIGDKNTLYENYVSGSPLNGDNNFRLTVEGGVVAHGYVATIQNWADWVFYEPWRNPTLEEEKANIYGRCALLGVPTEDDVKLGQNLAETDAVLLAKLEQNYLHDIKQQDMILLLLKQIAALEAEIRALKTVVEP